MVKFTDIFSDYKHDSELINGKVNNLTPIEKQLIEDYNLPVPSSEDQALWQDIFQQYSQLAETHNLNKLEYEIDASKLETNHNHEKSDL
jgi:hypothetical protein